MSGGRPKVERKLRYLEKERIAVGVFEFPGVYLYEISEVEMDCRELEEYGLQGLMTVL